MMSTAIVGYKGMTYLSMAAAPLLLGMPVLRSNGSNSDGNADNHVTESGTSGGH